MKTYAVNNLTKTELQIVQFLEKGLSNRSISEHCNVSENTIKFHLKNIYKKLNVHNRTEAIYQLKTQLL